MKLEGNDRFMKVALSLIIMPVIVFVLGCGSDDDKAVSPTPQMTAQQPEPTLQMTPEMTEPPVSLSEVVISPREMELTVGETGSFSVSVIGADGNNLPDAQVTWEMLENIGNISEDGVFTAGTRSGTFNDSVVAIATYGDNSVKFTGSVIIHPGSPSEVSISGVEVAAGESKQLSAAILDKYGNIADDTTGIWSISNEEAGSITETGMLTAGKVAGSFTDAVQVKVQYGDQVHTAIADLTVTPGLLDQVVVAPKPARIGIGMTQKFVAVGADQYGNRIADLVFKWSVENGGGTIDEYGLFAAGKEPGTYENTIKAEAVQGDISRSVLADVEIEQDRIAFISYRNDDQADIYIMNADGSDIERVTHNAALEMSCSWSPDGRRIVYSSFEIGGGIMIVNDDGDWEQLVIEHDMDGIHTYPSWAPGGTKIAFTTMSNLIDEDTDNWESDIFVIGIDGGNLTQLTDTDDGTEWIPSWSPDGEQIVYDYTPKYRGGDIWAMKADGSDSRRLSIHAGNDTWPVWSPDDTSIAFHSDREGKGDLEIFVMGSTGNNVRQITHNTASDTEPSWSPDSDRLVFVSNRDVPDREDSDSAEIYVMDADGGDVTRLTTDLAEVTSPSWAPRKAGIHITDAAVIIPNTSGYSQTKDAQQITASARKAVVKIKTDLGSGSGFIIDPDGMIITNSHVVVDAEEITVYLDDGTSYPGEVISRDIVVDVALVKIEADELPILQWGDAGQLNLGQQVLVLGYPLESKAVNVTSGLVSSVEFDEGRGIYWVKTDSVVNPGNSGCPLLNLQGQVVGVISSKVVGVAVEGTGYAISSNTVRSYLPRMKNE